MQHIKASLTVNENELWHHSMAFSKVAQYAKAQWGVEKNFLWRVDNLRGDCAVSSCPGWNAGAWPHIPHGGSTPDTQGSQCPGRRLTNAASHGWAWFFSPNTKGNSLDANTIFTVHKVASAQTHTSLFLARRCCTCSAIHGNVKWKNKEQIACWF